MRIKVLASHPGGYPRPPELRKAIDAYNSKKLDYLALRDTWERVMGKVIQEQTEEGLDVLTTGHLLWDDVFRPFAASWAGFELPEVGGYYRFYELNFYYKRAFVKGPIYPLRPVTITEHAIAESVSPRSLKASLPGPLTFALHVDNQYYKRFDELISDIAKALSYEISHLTPYVDYVQLEEPALVDPEVPNELKALGIEFINMIADASEVPIIVKTYFKNPENVYKMMLDLRVNGLGFDMTVWNYDEAKSMFSEYGYPYQIIDLGATDALNVKLEPIEETAAKLRNVIDETSAREVHVSASYRYDVLPYSYIRKKMRRLAEITFKLRELVNEG